MVWTGLELLSDELY